MLRRIRGNSIWTVLPGRRASLAALVAISASAPCAEVALAQSSANRAVLSDPANPLPPQSSTPAPCSPLRPTPVPRPSVSTAGAAGIRNPQTRRPQETNKATARDESVAPTLRIPAQGREALEETGNAKLTGPLASKRNSSEQPASSKANVQSQYIEEIPPIDADWESNPGGATELIPPLSQPMACPPEYCPPVETWEDEYSSYIDQVIPGTRCQCRCEDETLGDWWHQESERFITQNRELAHVVPAQLNHGAGQLKIATRSFIEDHTLPPEHDYDIDVYDQNQVAMAAPQVESPSRAATADDNNKDNDKKDDDEPGKNRLNTDIRKIRPNLSYAMRNIEENQLPEGFNEKLHQGQYVARQPSPAVLQWAPTNLYHYPLYFEDPSLERYGHTYHPVVQPFASAGRFATQLVGLPYQMTLHPVHAHEYTLGYYRPGECAPKKHYQIPFNEEAAFMQAAAIAGFFLILP